MRVNQSSNGCVIDQAVGRRFVTAEAQVRSQNSQCEICCGLSGTDTRYSAVLASSPGVIIQPFDLFNYLHLHIVLGPGVA